MPGSRKSPHGAHREKMDPNHPNNRSQAPIRLLLVDDEKGFADVLSKRLAKRKHPYHPGLFRQRRDPSAQAVRL